MSLNKKSKTRPVKERTSTRSGSIPDACVTRLSLYLREVTHLRREGRGYVSSRWLAGRLGLTDAQVRRDLSYFGHLGTSGRGYAVPRLQERLTQILGVSGRIWHVALAGVGNLGSALLAHQGFRERGFLFKVAVDADPERIGSRLGGVTIAASNQLAQLAQTHQVNIGLIAVPAQAAQSVCDQLVSSGVKAIMNFAPIRLEAPQDVQVRNVDLSIELEGLAFYLTRDTGQKKHAANLDSPDREHHTFDNANAD